METGAPCSLKCPSAGALAVWRCPAAEPGSKRSSRCHRQRAQDSDSPRRSRCGPLRAGLATAARAAAKQRRFRAKDRFRPKVRLLFDDKAGELKTGPRQQLQLHRRHVHRLADAAANTGRDPVLVAADAHQGREYDCEQQQYDRSEQDPVPGRRPVSSAAHLNSGGGRYAASASD